MIMSEKAPSDNNVEYWTHLFYFIACPRKGGEPPTLEKAIDQRFFLFYEAAEEYLREKVNEEIRQYFKVFQAIAVIPHLPAVAAEVGLDQQCRISVEMTKTDVLIPKGIINVQ